MEEDIGMACYVVYKQDRDDAQKVNTESPIPTSFVTLRNCSAKKM